MVADTPCVDVATLEAEWRDALIAKDDAVLRRLIHPRFKLVGIRSTGSVAVDLEQWILALRRMDIASLDVRSENFLQKQRAGTELREGRVVTGFPKMADIFREPVVHCRNWLRLLL